MGRSTYGRIHFPMDLPELPISHRVIQVLLIELRFFAANLLSNYLSRLLVWGSFALLRTLPALGFLFLV